MKPGANADPASGKTSSVGEERMGGQEEQCRHGRRKHQYPTNTSTRLGPGAATLILHDPHASVVELPGKAKHPAGRQSRVRKGPGQCDAKRIHSEHVRKSGPTNSIGHATRKMNEANSGIESKVKM